ncbi:MAG: hypothetical protein ACTHN7_06355 [Solirubrobacterales bacterium]
MKHLKMLGAAAAAAMALMAFLGGGTASATVLCGTETSPCSAIYPGEGTTTLSAHLASKNSILELVRNETGETTELSRCPVETLTASVINAGGAFSTVVASAGLESSECVGPSKTVVAFGTLEIHNIPGTTNGTVTAEAVEFTVNVSGVDCKWRASNVDLGTLKAGKDPELAINILLARNSLCYPEYLLRWTATFTFTSPTPLYVEPS